MHRSDVDVWRDINGQLWFLEEEAMGYTVCLLAEGEDIIVLDWASIICTMLWQVSAVKEDKGLLYNVVHGLKLKHSRTVIGEDGSNMKFSSDVIVIEWTLRR